MKNKKELELGILVIVLIILLDFMYLFKIVNLYYFLSVMIGLIVVCLIATIFCYVDLKKKSKVDDDFDSLTSLPNKNKFLNDLTEVIKRNNDTYCVISLDVRNFKNFIDVHGPSETNRFLKFMSNVLKENIVEDELASNINDDHFALLLKFENNEQIIDRLSTINEKIVNFNKNIKISLSFGIYVVTDRRFSSTMMLNKAGLSRKSIADQVDVLYAFYDDNLREETIKNSEIENYMEESLKRHDFIVDYQPKYSLNRKKVIGLEALVRWDHPRLGVLYPDSFISVFEKTNFILQLDLYVLEEVCKNINRWLKNGIGVVPVSVNLSRANLNNKDLIFDIQKVVKKHKIDPKYIEFEFTESIIYNNMTDFLHVIDILHQIGYQVSIDDFGAGHSSLNVLKNLPVDILKIDKEFLNENNAKGEIIISNTINLAKKLNMKVIMEGVETKKQISFLKKMNCDYAQGFYYNKPLSLKEIDKLLKSNRK